MLRSASALSRPWRFANRRPHTRDLLSLEIHFAPAI
jgi:hypothetical protein